MTAAIPASPLAVSAGESVGAALAEAAGEMMRARGRAGAGAGLREPRDCKGLLGAARSSTQPGDGLLERQHGDANRPHPVRPCRWCRAAGNIMMTGMVSGQPVAPLYLFEQGDAMSDIQAGIQVSQQHKVWAETLAQVAGEPEGAFSGLFGSVILRVRKRMFRTRSGDPAQPGAGCLLRHRLQESWPLKKCSENSGGERVHGQAEKGSPAVARSNPKR